MDGIVLMLLGKASRIHSTPCGRSYPHTIMCICQLSLYLEQIWLGNIGSIREHRYSFFLIMKQFVNYVLSLPNFHIFDYSH